MSQSKPSKRKVSQPEVPAPTPAPQVMTEEQGRLAAELQKARDSMYSAMANYRALLQDSTLAGNRSKVQKDEIERVFIALNVANGEMEKLNFGEAPLALIFTALNSALLVKDQVNELKFGNAVLLRRLEVLEKQVNRPLEKATMSESNG